MNCMDEPSGIWAVTYSDDQQCYHRELLSEYRSNPKNGYRAIALFETPDECNRFIDLQMELPDSLHKRNRISQTVKLFAGIKNVI